MTQPRRDPSGPAVRGESAAAADPPLPASDPRWRAILEGTDKGFGRGRSIFQVIPSSPRCKLCAAPFSGFGAPFMRLIDRGRWEKNPTLCGMCFKHLQRNHGGAEIDLSLLFADVRGSTALAESMGPEQFRHLMDRFYRGVTEVLVHHDGIVDKFVGDEVVALFIPALTGARHATRALDAARDILRATGHADGGEPWVPVGVGVHSGRAFVGSVGDTVTDFTALGDSVNVAARLSSVAGPGEILVSAAAAVGAGLDTGDRPSRSVTLRGRTEPLDVYALRL